MELYTIRDEKGILAGPTIDKATAIQIADELIKREALRVCVFDEDTQTVVWPIH